ncbi:hypothetical protein BCR33DRAFT_712555 [Rhizoclosmatium globosum]|uniref:Uncharacterized protein n=1 Tax=Rhizoclosmatium globosum TaxID=329046 RepID=A0A1Y2CXF0_9FUNG|nr:hypothetical protein BCR33DRAFT_712555 [Rhizoclosmatium globosum]|eukprot:ORY51514.1 hypothetical protein BCR33DRAFT_712555 [Rhizoclosmatium globosum]
MSCFESNCLLPRFPEIKVYSLDLTNLANSSSAYRFTYLNGSNNLNQIEIRMNLTMNLGTYNPNPYGLLVDRIDVSAQMMVNTSYVFSDYLTKQLTSFGSVVEKVGPAPVNPFPDTYFGKNDSVVGSAQSTSAIYFPPKEWLNYTLNFELYYTPDKYLGLLKDPTVLELADGCGITSRYKPPGRPMQIHYTATSQIGALKWLNYAPSLSNGLKIRCPFSQDQIDGVINYTEQGYSVEDAIKIVFEGAQIPPPNSSQSQSSDASNSTSSSTSSF